MARDRTVKSTVHGHPARFTRSTSSSKDNQSSKYQLGALLIPIGSTYLSSNEFARIPLNWSEASESSGLCPHGLNQRLPLTSDHAARLVSEPRGSRGPRQCR